MNDNNQSFDIITKLNTIANNVDNMVEFFEFYTKMHRTIIKFSKHVNTLLKSNTRNLSLIIEVDLDLDLFTNNGKVISISFLFPSLKYKLNYINNSNIIGNKILGIEEKINKIIGKNIFNINENPESITYTQYFIYRIGLYCLIKQHPNIIDNIKTKIHPESSDKINISLKINNNIDDDKFIKFINNH
jgi:hypothetical protein